MKKIIITVLGVCVHFVYAQSFLNHSLCDNHVSTEEKVEELTLYILQMEERLKELESKE